MYFLYFVPHCITFKIMPKLFAPTERTPNEFISARGV